jgi:hypothetical protein
VRYCRGSVVHIHLSGLLSFDLYSIIRVRLSCHGLCDIRLSFSGQDIALRRSILSSDSELFTGPTRWFYVAFGSVDVHRCVIARIGAGEHGNHAVFQGKVRQFLVWIEAQVAASVPPLRAEESDSVLKRGIQPPKVLRLWQRH